MADYSKRIANIEVAVGKEFTHEQRVDLQEFFVRAAESIHGDKTTFRDGWHEITIGTAPKGGSFTVQKWSRWEGADPLDEAMETVGHWQGKGNEPLKWRSTKWMEEEEREMAELNSARQDEWEEANYGS